MTSPGNHFVTNLILSLAANFLKPLIAKTSVIIFLHVAAENNKATTTMPEQLSSYNTSHGYGDGSTKQGQGSHKKQRTNTDNRQKI